MLFNIQLQLFASKKGASSTKNGRDSESKRLGVKCHDGSTVKSGNILVRQRGTRPGTNANKVSSLPIPTLVPGWKCVPR